MQRGSLQWPASHSTADQGALRMLPPRDSESRPSGDQVQRPAGRNARLKWLYYAALAAGVAVAVSALLTLLARQLPLPW